MANFEINDEFSDEESLSQFLEDQENSFTENLNTTAISTQRPLLDCESPSPQHVKVLKKYFGHTTFRSLQWKIINSILQHKRDNLAIMSTGYGKSLCYQFPAVYSGGITLVISPLISLMEDQVYQLKVAKIPACLLGSAQTEQAKVVREIFENKYSIIYCAPEFAIGEYGSEILNRMGNELNVCLVAVDEAHCVSSWGHDFRKHYSRLSQIRKHLVQVPMLAVTATATKEVEEDIARSLRLRNPQILHSGFDRPNLYLEVYPMNQQGPFSDLIKIMDKVSGRWEFSGPTIIYSPTRKSTEDIAITLKSKGINCAAYHAGMGLKERKNVHEKFLRDQIQLIVATVAFGMGIDKPDIRNVIHYKCPSSMEGYYQEIGRAGRDGEPSRCVMFFSEKDFQTHRNIRDNNPNNNISVERSEILLGIVRKYMYTTECRRAFVLKYFGETYTGQNERCCDNCDKSKGDQQKYDGLDENGLYDFTEDAEKMLTAVDALGGRFGLTTYTLFLRGSKSTKIRESCRSHPAYGSGKDKNESWWKSIMNILVDNNHIVRKGVTVSRFTTYVFELTVKGRKFLDDVSSGKSVLKTKPGSDILEQLKVKPKIQVLSYNTGMEAQSSSKAVLIQDTITKNKDDELNKKLYAMITSNRYKIADEHDCMPHNVISIPDIREIIRVKPRSLKDLAKCKFDMFSEVKIHQFGQLLIDMIVEVVGPATDQNEDGTSIVEALQRVPLLEKHNESAEVTYNLFKHGKSIQQICEQRVLSPGTIFNHLIDCMKRGLPITLKQMGVDELKAKIILRAILETPDHLMTPIKEKCPPEVSWNDIKVMLAYYKVRNHLIENQIIYEDFEDFCYETLESEAGAVELKPSTNSEHGMTEEDRELEEFLRLGQEILREEESKSVEKESSDFSALKDVEILCESNKKQSEETVEISDDETIIIETKPMVGTSNHKRTLSDDFERSCDLFDEAFDSPPSTPKRCKFKKTG